MPPAYLSYIKGSVLRCAGAGVIHPALCAALLFHEFHKNDLAGFDAGHLQHLVDQREELIARRFDLVQIVFDLLLERNVKEYCLLGRSSGLLRIASISVPDFLLTCSVYPLI